MRKRLNDPTRWLKNGKHGLNSFPPGSPATRRRARNSFFDDLLADDWEEYDLLLDSE